MILLGQVVAANTIPQIVSPEDEPIQQEIAQFPAGPDQSSLEQLSEPYKTQAKYLLRWYAHPSKASLDQGKTILVKLKIEITNTQPFKEWYHCIPPQMYEEVKAHLQEMLDLDAIRHSQSPYASTMVLARKERKVV